jgi:hypothetical protein
MIFTKKKKKTNYFLEEKDYIYLCKKKIQFYNEYTCRVHDKSYLIRNNKDHLRYISIAFIGQS